MHDPAVRVLSWHNRDFNFAQYMYFSGLSFPVAGLRAHSVSHIAMSLDSGGGVFLVGNPDTRSSDLVRFLRPSYANAKKHYDLLSFEARFVDNSLPAPCG